MTQYRKIYEAHFGPIPKGFHIHHKDGNSKNNQIENLQCVSPSEHFEIHLSQGDFDACLALVATGHLEISTEQRSFLAKEMNLRRVKNGTHPWQKKPDGSSISSRNAKVNGSKSRIRQLKLIAEGKHHFLKHNRKKEVDIKKSNTLKARYKETKFSERMRNAKIGRKWKLSPELAKKVSAHLVPFTYETASLCKDTIWINNGTIEKRIKGPIPKDWKRGRLCKKKNINI